MILAEKIISLIRYRYPALIWVNSAEWEVLCSRLAFGQHVEKCGFPAMRRLMVNPAFVYSPVNQPKFVNMHIIYYVLIPNIR